MRRTLAGLLLLCASAASAASPSQVTVVVDGLQGTLLKNVLAYLSINTYDRSPDLSQSLVDRLNARAPDEIRQALQPYGYYNAGVKTELSTTSSGWLAHYTVSLPPPVHLRHIDITLTGEGRADPGYDAFFQKLPFRPGDQLNQTAYEAAKRNLQELAARRGYIDARFVTARLEVNPDEHWADVTLRFNTGPRYYFGEISFVQDFLDPAFLARYVKFKPGDPFDNDALLKLQYALNDAGYFGSVNVVPERQQTVDRRIPIKVTLTSRKHNAYTAGVGYGTDTGPRITLGWTDRQVNDEGHTAAAQAQLSHVSQTLLLTYTVPLTDPAADRLIYSLGNSRQTQLGSFTSYTSILGVSRATARGVWTENQYLQLEHDRSNLAAVSTNSTLLIPGITVSRVESDDVVLPTRGYRISADLHGSNNTLFSDTTFLQLHIATKLMLPLGDMDSLLLRGEVGATAVKSFAELPATQRFYAGGDQSVRGYEYNSLGVRDAQGDVLGGQDLMVGSIELDHRFGPIFGVAAFIDTGDAMNSFTSSLQKGAGLGLRWRTPVGMVRFDVAHPIKRPDLGVLRVHISIGPDL